MTAADPAPSLAELLRHPQFEVVPVASLAAAAEDLPPGATVAVTASPRQGMDATIDTAVSLAGRGFTAVPHLSARLTRDHAHVAAMLGRLRVAGIDQALVVGGDGDPSGDFADAEALLDALDDVGHGLAIGICGYPEGHPLIPDAELAAALRRKAARVAYVATQMCFDPAAIVAWIDRIRTAGVTLPVVAGVPGPVSLHRLAHLAARIGVGRSIRFLSRHRGLLRSVLSPRYSPDALLRGLAGADLAGLHLYTFNDVAATEHWRAGLLAELATG